MERGDQILIYSLISKLNLHLFFRFPALVPLCGIKHINPILKRNLDNFLIK